MQRSEDVEREHQEQRDQIATMWSTPRSTLTLTDSLYTPLLDLDGHRQTRPKWPRRCCVVPIVEACLVFLTLALWLGLHSTSAPQESEDEATTHTAVPLQNTTNTTDDPHCDAMQINSNGTSVCLVRTWPPECLGYVALAGLVGFTAFFLTLPCILAAIGFGFIGITAGSLAALFQANCGTPCCFRCAQSTAMLGTPCVIRVFFAVVGLIVGLVVGAYWVPMCFTEEGSPVSGFMDGVSDAYEISHNYTSDKLDPLWGHAKDAVHDSFNSLKALFNNTD